MKLKTYRASSMADALASVRRDLGMAAVILHTRSYKVGAILGFGGKPVVEITASDDPRAMGPRQVRELAAAPVRPLAGSPGVGGQGTAGALAGAAEGAAEAVAAQAVRRATAAVGSQNGELAAASSAGSEQTIEQLRGELAAIRHMVGEALHSRAAEPPKPPTSPRQDASAPSDTGPLVAEYSRLIQAQVSRELAGVLMAAVRAELSQEELASTESVRSAMRRQIERMIPVAAGATPGGKQADGRPLMIALVGPTGVGKTTTIAKLAATYQLKHQLRVGLITTDTYRIGAVDQLRTYAGIIGVPLRVAMTAVEARAAVEALADCDVILIDTAGRSPTDTRRLGELADMLALTRPHETHLVLSSTAGEGSLRHAVKGFGGLRPDRVILTKLDETVGMGVVLSVLREAAVQLSYLTTGQEVPADIEQGSSSRLAGLVLDDRAEC
jgi:flagellar biosynthesis protein FlhF